MKFEPKPGDIMMPEEFLSLPGVHIIEPTFLKCEKHPDISYLKVEFEGVTDILTLSYFCDDDPETFIVIANPFKPLVN